MGEENDKTEGARCNVSTILTWGIKRICIQEAKA